MKFEQGGRNMKLLIGFNIVGMLIFTSCASAPPVKSGMTECRALCLGNHVQEYKDDGVECKCQLVIPQGK